MTSMFEAMKKAKIVETLQDVRAYRLEQFVGSDDKKAALPLVGEGNTFNKLFGGK